MNYCFTIVYNIYTIRYENVELLMTDCLNPRG